MERFLTAATPIDGCSVLDSQVAHPDRLSDLAEVLVRDAYGEPYRIFKRYELWKPLRVDLDRPPGKSQGIGHNSLHIDCVNMENPPELIALHCLRPDPLGGGVSVVSPLKALWSVSADSRQELERGQFDEGEAYDLENAGACLRDFPVLPMNRKGWIRWSGRFLESGGSQPMHAALVEASEALNRRQLHVRLEAGQTLVIDQRLLAHGRTALGEGQEHVPPDQRRHLVQCYLRRPGSSAEGPTTSAQQAHG